jgi:hypothetical protein
MTHCLECGKELVWVSTPIDDIKECPENMDHTVLLNTMKFPNDAKLTMEVVYSDWEDAAK